jgi:hypothetical protein
MSSRFGTNLGGASEQGLKSVAEYLSAGIATPRALPWNDTWFDVFEKWHNSQDSGHVVLVFSKESSVLARNIPGTKTIFLVESEARLESGIYIVGRESSGNAWLLPESGLDFQKDCGALVSQAKLANLPSIVLRSESDHVYFFPNGLASANDGGIKLPNRTDKSAFDDSLLKQELQHFADEVIPLQHVRDLLWEDAGKYLPKDQAEESIQVLMAAAFNQMFKRYFFDPETITKAGRIDLRVIARDSSIPGRSVIELKVMRQFSSSGRTEYNATQIEKQLREGVLQAAHYDQGAKHKYLCAFDMRKDRTVQFVSVEDACQRRSVAFLRYDVPNSAKAVRHFMDAAT